MRYLNTRLSYYYFWFVKTNVRHIKILLPVSILTYSSSWGLQNLPQITGFRENWVKM